MVQAPTPSSARDIDVDQVLRVDREHLIHPLYHPADHAKPMVIVRGEGAEIIDANGKRYFDALSGLWNVNVGHGRAELAQVAAEQMGTLAFNNNYVGFVNVPVRATGRKADRASPTPISTRCTSPPRRRVQRVGLQDRALLLEAPGQAGQGQDHLAPLGLPRRDDGRRERDGPARVSQDVRAAGAQLHADDRPVPLPLRARGEAVRGRAPTRPRTTTPPSWRRRCSSRIPRPSRPSSPSPSRAPAA